jgi:hypothetical protein
MAGIRAYLDCAICPGWLFHSGVVVVSDWVHPIVHLSVWLPGQGFLTRRKNENHEGPRRRKAVSADEAPLLGFAEWKILRKLAKMAGLGLAGLLYYPS